MAAESARESPQEPPQDSPAKAGERAIDRDLGHRYGDICWIGRGQSSSVYRGTDRATGQIMALKALDRQGSTALFLQELSALLQLRHPNLVSCHGIEYGPQSRYLVMDYCAGGTLRDRLEHSPEPIPAAQILDWLDDSLQGLAQVHRRGLLHCDLKPENMLLSHWPPIGDFPAENRPIVRISDFGLVRLQSQGHFELGSPAYMAPERFEGRVCPGSDLYALGILLFELLTGDRPFHGTPHDLRLAHRDAPIPALPEGRGGPIAPPIPNSEWEAILQIALHKRPGDRFTDADAFRQALQGLRLFMIL
jgi:serine/threonine protein kinase